jgi:hypothetical protein
MPTYSDTSSSYSTDTLRQSLGELLGLARGLLADQELSDGEIEFLDKWLEDRYAMTSSFPGNVIHDRIKEVLEDGVITEDEREHLVETLNMLVEGRLDDLTEQVDLSELWFDEVGLIEFKQTKFCLTGDFVYGPREVCKTAIEERGGIVAQTVNNEPQILVVGGLGVDEWRTGGLGVEIEAALKLRAKGVALKIIPEGSWVTQL